MSDVWYQDGLKFSCTRCGNCCTGEPGYVWVEDAELRAIAEMRGQPVQQVVELYTKVSHRGLSLRERANGDCVFFERGEGCTIYANRPRQCRTWPFWESNLRSREAWKQMQKGCPGAGQGELIQVEEITARMNVIRL